MVIGTELFLVEAQTFKVFSAERDAAGELVPVGTWDPVQKKLLPLPQDGVVTSTVAFGAQATSVGTQGDQSAAISAVEFPYSVEDDDHCETPANAYADIAPLLEQLCIQLHKSKAELRIYDPFFCNGVRRKFGFRLRR